MSAGFAALAAPLTRGELAIFGTMMYRAGSRLCDSAEAYLHEADTSPPCSAHFTDMMRRCEITGRAMREAAYLHAEVCTELARRSAENAR